MRHVSIASEKRRERGGEKNKGIETHRHINIIVHFILFHRYFLGFFFGYCRNEYVARHTRIDKRRRREKWPKITANKRHRENKYKIMVDGTFMFISIVIAMGALNAIFFSQLILPSVRIVEHFVWRANKQTRKNCKLFAYQTTHLHFTICKIRIV